MMAVPWTEWQSPVTGTWVCRWSAPHDVHHRRQSAQEAEDAARSARVADVDIHAVFLGDLDVVPPDLGAARKDGGQHHIRAFERFNPVEGGGHFGGILPGLNKFQHGLVGKVEPFGVDIHQGNMGIFQQRKGQDVAHKSGGEAEASGADEGDLGHEESPGMGFIRRLFRLIKTAE
jgi:hypothetical protein